MNGLILTVFSTVQVAINVTINVKSVKKVSKESLNVTSILCTT